MSQPDLTEKRGRLRRAWIRVSAAAIAIVLFVTLVIVKPGMPDRIVLLTGSEKARTTISASATPKICAAAGSKPR